jgi:hypothetical protein
LFVRTTSACTTPCFVRLSVESFLVCNNVAAFLYGWRSASGSLLFIFLLHRLVAGSDSMLDVVVWGWVRHHV